MDFSKKAGGTAVDKKKEKTIPLFLKEDYPYKAAGNEITDIKRLEPDVVYEIRCPVCKINIRSQGEKTRTTYERLKNVGCISCGNTKLVIRMVEMDRKPADNLDNE